MRRRTRLRLTRILTIALVTTNFEMTAQWAKGGAVAWAVGEEREFSRATRKNRKLRKITKV